MEQGQTPADVCPLPHIVRRVPGGPPPVPAAVTGTAWPMLRRNGPPKSPCHASIPLGAHLRPRAGTSVPAGERTCASRAAKARPESGTRTAQGRNATNYGFLYPNYRKARRRVVGERQRAYLCPVARRHTTIETNPNKNVYGKTLHHLPHDSFCRRQDRLCHGRQNQRRRVLHRPATTRLPHESDGPRHDGALQCRETPFAPIENRPIGHTTVHVAARPTATPWPSTRWAACAGLPPR